VGDITALLKPFVCDDDAMRAPRLARVSEGGTSVERLKSKGTRRERERVQRATERVHRIEDFAIMDLETTPLDPDEDVVIKPFVACIYTREFGDHIIWEEDKEKLAQAIYDYIVALPRSFTIYAHNGGRFDWKLLLKHIKGRVSFKGNAIMSATLGPHELRDSLHIIPEKLAKYKKDNFDYDWLKEENRNDHRDAIITYLKHDCLYLADIVEAFLQKFGRKISIGQAAIAELRKSYKTEKITEGTDTFLRNYFFGGRVECLAGRGIFRGDYKLYDVNSMYPFVMATKRHPIGQSYIPRRGKPGANTFFLQVRCYSKGAFVERFEGKTEARWRFGTYMTTIHEYEVALKHGLIKNAKILWCIDNANSTTFEKFVLPMYEARLATKALLKKLAAEGKEESDEYFEAKRNDIFYKLLLNNAYGKFAQNPRRFKETFYGRNGETPETVLPENEREGWNMTGFDPGEGLKIYERKAPRRSFNNVGTAASITGAARAVLLDAIWSAVDPIYCDTDSIICKELRGHDLHATHLGAWDIEKEIEEIVITGKKMYAYRTKDGKEYVKAKGTNGVTYKDMLDVLAGRNVVKRNLGPTIDKLGEQAYIRRKISATAPLLRDRRYGIKSAESLSDWKWPNSA